MNNDHMKAISMFEQASAFLNSFATFLSSYHTSLCQAGFNRKEALILVKKLQDRMFTDAFNNGTKKSDEDDNYKS